MTHIRIEVTREGLKKRHTTRQFRNRQDAMDSWDWSLENSALPGDVWRMIDLETGRIMSEYKPTGGDE